MAGDIALNLRRDAELLLQLADKRLRLALAGLHFAAGKFP
jgi:hypothetical protein